MQRIDDASASPARAANVGIELATGELVGLIIDGARLASPRLLSMARTAARVADRPIVTAPAWHLGDAVHMQAADSGYDATAEDALLAESRLGVERLRPVRGLDPCGVVGSRLVRTDGREQLTVPDP